MRLLQLLFFISWFSAGIQVCQAGRRPDCEPSMDPDGASKEAAPAFHISPSSTFSDHLIDAVFLLNNNPPLFQVTRNSEYTDDEIDVLDSSSIAALEATIPERLPRGYLKSPNLKNFLAVSEKLSAFGKQLKTQVTGSTVLDLACGLPEQSTVHRVLAQIFEAKRYLGIDSGQDFPNKTVKNEFGRLDRDFNSTFVRSDVVEFLRTWSRGRIRDTVTILVEGLEYQSLLFDNYSATFAYMTELMTLLQKKTRARDTLLIGHAVSWLHPEKDVARFHGKVPTIDPGHFGFRRVGSKDWKLNLNSKSTVNGRHDIWIRQP